MPHGYLAIEQEDEMQMVMIAAESFFSPEVGAVYPLAFEVLGHGGGESP